jgi:hypothetical protein
MAPTNTQVFTRGLSVPRGPLSATVVTALAQGPSSEQLPLADVDQADPYGEDLTLALYTFYELHYRGFDGVDPLWEWEPELLRLRAMMERAFLTALRSDTGGGDDVTGRVGRVADRAGARQRGLALPSGRCPGVAHARVHRASLGVSLEGG